MKQYKDTNYWVNEQGQVYNSKGHEMLGYMDRGWRKLLIVLNGKKVTRAVHRMVAECYLANPDNLPQVNHLDGNKHNNHVSNLEWVTAKQNIQHAWDAGLSTPNKGEDNGTSKLTNKIVQDIRYLYHELEWKQYKIAAEFGVSPEIISRVLRGKSWSHV